MACISDAMGLATINPVAGSSLIGFGTPPDAQINFSIVYFHGTLDDTIPYDDRTSVGNGPYDTVISYDGYYYERKELLLANWAKQMECEDTEENYPTFYDGQNDFQCWQRHCKNGKDILRCIGSYGHDYALPGHSTVAAEIAYEFMKSHPRA